MADKKEAEGKGRKGDDVTGPMMDAFNGWLAYIKRNAVRYYLGLLKIQLATLFASWVLLIAFLLLAIALLIGAGIGYGGIVDDITSNAVVLGFVVVCLILGFLALKWVERTIQLTALVFTEAEFSRGRFGLIQSALRICWPVLRLTLAELGLFLLFLLPAVLIAAFGFAVSSSIGGVIAMVLIVIYAIAMTLAYSFLAQFWSYGVVLEGRGVLDALKRSVRIAKGNIVEVLLFDVVWLAGMLVFGIPLIAYSLVSEIAEQILGFMMESGDLTAVGVYILFVIVSAILATAFATIMEAFGTPSHYLFWKSMKRP